MNTNTEHGALPELPPYTWNLLNVIRRIRSCEDEAAASIVLEHAIREYARAAIQQAAVALPEVKPAMERFNASIGDESDPIERLRFFCSIVMNEQDWLDVEPLFDALVASQAPPKQPVHLGSGECGGVPLTAGQTEIQRLYQELIYAVGIKFPGESRHETALRYIKRMEAPTGQINPTPADQTKEGPT